MKAMFALGRGRGNRQEGKFVSACCEYEMFAFAMTDEDGK